MYSNQAIADLSKCDILSLGLTGLASPLSLLLSPCLSSRLVYGLCTGCCLESDGDQWFQIRDGVFLFPESIDSPLIDLIAALSSPDPEARPSASYCIHNYTVLMTAQEIQLKEQLDKIRELERRLKIFTEEQQQQQQTLVKKM